MIEGTLGVSLLVVSLLLEIFFSISRAAFVNSRLSQLKAFEESGERQAALAVRVLSQARKLILSLRIAQAFLRLVIITLSVLTFLPLEGLQPGQGIGILIAIIAVSGLGIGLLEFVAEHWATREPEKNAIRTSRFVAVVVRIFEPLGWVLLRLAHLISDPTGKHLSSIVTEEEIMTLVDAGEEDGVIEEEEKAMIYSIFQLGNTLAREVMVPRIDLMAFNEDTSLENATETLLRTGHSRAPVYAESIDNVIGLVYIKDLLAAWHAEDLDKNVGDLLREAYFVPEAKKVDDLLAEMQVKRVHMAIVVDEYGGTAGLVTIEDIVEEIVGEIRDEYDFAEELAYEQVQENVYMFSGGIDLDDVNLLTGAQVPKEMSETLGGFIYSQLGKVPAPGEVVDAGGLRFVVEEVVGRRIRKIRAEKLETAETEKDSHANNPAG
ncbi:MAG: HlyC/CorC family transporter [Anaerolineales bacterium]|nr:MAG: HlyC/CorC family transporter [Anaerolineales bacterium]